MDDADTAVKVVEGTETQEVLDPSEETEVAEAKKLVSEESRDPLQTDSETGVQLEPNVDVEAVNREQVIIKQEQMDPTELAESLAQYINLTTALDTETVLQVVSPKLFDHFTIFELMLQKARLSMDFGAMETLLNDTSTVLSELKLLIESCLRPVKAKRFEEDQEDGTPKKNRGRKRYNESVDIDDMMAMALCINPGIWKKRDPEEIDYYSNILNVECLFPEKRERTKPLGRPKGSLGAKKRIKKEDDHDEDEDYFAGDDAKTDEIKAVTDSARPKRRGRKPKRFKTEEDNLNESISDNIEIKKEKEKLTCEKCGKTYNSTNALYKHIEKTCAARESMKVEFNRVNDEFFCAFPDCPDAKTTFATKEDVDDHWAEFHVKEEDKIIPCGLCNVKFATTGARKVHMNRDHEKKFKCEECPKTFFTKGNLSYHMKSHTKIKLEDGTEMLGENYLCLKCGQTLCKAYGKQHEAKCTGMFVRHPKYKKLNDEFFCTVDGCNIGYGFNSIYGVRQHFHAAHIREEEKFFSCDYCDEKFSFKTTRNKHVKAKHLKTHVCDICGKGFGGKDKLTCHRYTHTGEKPFMCDKCDYRAAKKYNLEMHKQSKHSDFEQKNFLCAICNKQFVTMGRVRRHMQVIHAEGKETPGKKKRRMAPLPPGLQSDVSQDEQQSQQEVVHHVDDQQPETIQYIAPPQETVITVTPLYQ